MLPLFALCASIDTSLSDAAALDWSLEHGALAEDPKAVLLLATGSAVSRQPVEQAPGAPGFLQHDRVELEAPSPVETAVNEPGWRWRALDLATAARVLTSMPEVESQQFWDKPKEALAALGPQLHHRLMEVQTKAQSHVRYVAMEAGLSVPLFVMGFVAVMVATLVVLSVLLNPSKVRESYEPETRLQASHQSQHQEQDRPSARLSARHSARMSSPHVLCRELVVPRGNEFLFAMKSTVSRLPQSDQFDVVDPENCGFCSVVFCEKPEDASFLGMQGILLRASEPLAFLDTSPLFQRRSTGQMPMSRRALAGDDVQLKLYRASREVFGTLQLECDVPRKYSVRVSDGSLLMSFLGDFRESAVTVHNAQGQLIATTEQHTFSFSLDPHIRVRAAHLVDTSILMLGLIGAAKME